MLQRGRLSDDTAWRLIHWAADCGSGVASCRAPRAGGPGYQVSAVARGGTAPSAGMDSQRSRPPALAM